MTATHRNRRYRRRVPISWVSLAVELQRDWARQDTVAAIIEIVLTDRLLKEQEST